MNSQEKIAYLKQAFNLNKRINRHEREKQQLEILWSKCTSSTASYENDGTTSGSKSNSNERSFIDYSDAHAEYRKLIDSEVDELIKLKLEIRNAINTMKDDTLKGLLIDRYILFLDWEQIAKEMPCHERTVYKIHGRALQELEVKLGS